MMKRTRLTLTVLALALLSGCSSVAMRAADESGDELYPVSRSTAPEQAAPPVHMNAAAQAENTDPPADDFWSRMRSGFTLPASTHRSVNSQVRSYSRHPAQVEKIFRRASPYLSYILGEVEKRNYPAEIALLPFVESGYDPFAYSHGRAAGLWQFIPGTGRLYGLEQDWWYDGRRDVVASTTAALDYLGWLHGEFGGDWLLALAAYNSGSGTVRNAISRNRMAGKPTDFWHLRLPRETSAYVPRLLAITAIVKQPGHYGVSLAGIEPDPAFRLADTGGQIDLAVAAELAGMDTQSLHLLNPGYNRWATHPNGPHWLALPADRLDSFTAGLEQLPEEQRTRWIRHRIKPGETLSHIAKRYNTTVAVLRSTNTLHGSRIRAGQHLLVPVAAREPQQYAGLNRGVQASQPLTYTVRNGDSLWDIARKHRVSVKQLSSWNGLNAAAVIRPGQQLLIREGEQGGTGSKHIRTISYTVKRGDSLYRIAKKFDVSIRDVRRWNKLSEDKHLQPGQRLTLYIDVTEVAAG